MTTYIDINCDLGESNLAQHPEHLQFFDFISSCNIATGFHAGDPTTIYLMIQKAIEKEVSIGAHPSYPDKNGFGRISMKMDPDELFASLSYQVSALSGMCRMAGTRLNHIKLHGALYHDAHHREEIAEVIIDLLRSFPYPISLYGIKNSILGEMALHAGFPFYSEGFVDRRYDHTGRLLPRTHPDSTLTHMDELHLQALDIIRHQRVKTDTGEFVALQADTLCIHSDHTNSLKTAQSLHEMLSKFDIQIKRPGK